MTTVAAALIVSSLAESATPAQPIDGYLVYLKSDQKLSDVEFKKNDAVVVRPRLLQIKDDGKKISAEIEFRVMKNGAPSDPPQTGWIDLDQLSLTKPLAKTNSMDWTMEPPKAEPPKPPVPVEPPSVVVTPETPTAPTPCDIASGCHTETPVKAPISIRAPLAALDAAKMTQIITEFHDSAFCSSVNSKVDTSGSSRRELFLKAWDDYIASKTGHGCERSSKADECQSFNRARELDFITRTAVFEAEPPSKKYPPEQTKIRSRCELDLILLTLRRSAARGPRSNRCHGAAAG